MNLKPGQRLASAVCATNIVVVKAPDESVDLRCGGAPMVPHEEVQDVQGDPASGFDAGTEMGKRYAHDLGLEVMCTAGGEGTLSLGDDVIEMKATKPLPSTD